MMSPDSDKTYDLSQAIFKLFSYFKPKHSFSDLKPTKIMVLMSIRHLVEENGYAVPSMICDELGLSKSSLTAILNEFEEQNFITREISKEDRRMLLLSLTEKAKAKICEHHSYMKKSISDLIDYLGEEDADKLTELIIKANNYFEKR